MAASGDVNMYYAQLCGVVHHADLLRIDMVFTAMFPRLVSAPSELPIQCAGDWGSGLLHMGLY